MNRKDHAKAAGQKIACAHTLLGSSLETAQSVTYERRVLTIMANINAFTGVGVAGMSRTLHVAEAPAAAAHPAFAAHAAAGPSAAAIPSPRKRRTATATGTSVDRGST